MLHQEALDAHGVRLAQPVHPVDRLLLHRRIPPRVEQVDQLGRHEVEADAARAEGEQQDADAIVGGEGRERRRARLPGVRIRARLSVRNQCLAAAAAARRACWESDPSRRVCPMRSASSGRCTRSSMAVH